MANEEAFVSGEKQMSQILSGGTGSDGLSMVRALSHTVRPSVSLEAGRDRQSLLAETSRVFGGLKNNFWP